jgi:hypothetical protein
MARQPAVSAVLTWGFAWWGVSVARESDSLQNLHSMDELIVHLDDTASQTEVDKVREVVRSSGLTAEVRADWQKPQAGNGGFWMIVITCSGAVAAFVTGFAQEAGRKAFHKFRSFVRKLHRARRSSPFGGGWIEIKDAEGTTLIVGDLDKRAFDELRHVDWARRRGAHLAWDPEAEEWYRARRSSPFAGGWIDIKDAEGTTRPAAEPAAREIPSASVEDLRSLSDQELLERLRAAYRDFPGTSGEERQLLWDELLSRRETR